MFLPAFRFRIRDVALVCVVVGWLMGATLHRSQYPSRREQDVAELANYLSKASLAPHKFQFTDVARNAHSSEAAIVIFQGVADFATPGFERGVARFVVAFRDRFPVAPILIHYQKTIEVQSGVAWFQDGKSLEFYKFPGNPEKEVSHLLQRTETIFGL